MSPAISVVLFDLDDTLTDAAQFGATVLADAAKRYGYDLEIDAIRAYPGVRYEPQLVQQFHIDPSEAAAIYQAYVRLYNGMMRGALQPQPGASELLHALAVGGEQRVRRIDVSVENVHCQPQAQDYGMGLLNYLAARPSPQLCGIARLAGHLISIK